MNEKQETGIRKEKIIQAGAEMVFNALIEPEEITEWFQDDANLDPRVG